MRAASFETINTAEEYNSIKANTLYNCNYEEIANALKKVFQKSKENFIIGISQEGGGYYSITDLGFICKKVKNIKVYYTIYLKKGYYYFTNLDFKYKLFINKEGLKECDKEDLIDVINEIKDAKLKEELIKIDKEMRVKIKQAFTELGCYCDY